VFDLERATKMCRIPGAWVKQKDNLLARPDYGDIVRWNKFHVGVSLGFVGRTWHTIEGGQGGPIQNHDIIKFKKGQYNPGAILGWVNLATIYDAP